MHPLVTKDILYDVGVICSFNLHNNKIIKMSDVYISFMFCMFFSFLFQKQKIIFYSSAMFTPRFPTVKPYNKKLCHCCQTLAAFLMGTGAVRNFFRAETLGAHF